MKVQIVDESKLFGDSVKALLPDTFTVDICTDCEKAASRICSFRPDILVLAASMPGNDGFYVLQLVYSTGLRPKVLLTTPLISEYVAERIEELKISHIMCKPCNVQAVANNILNMQDVVVALRNTPEDWIRKFLLNLGVRTKLRGYGYLLTALELLQKDPSQPVSKVLYPAVAKHYKGSWQQIEHGIRLTIQNAWENRTGDNWEVYFPNMTEKPSNSAFLTRALEFLREMESQI